MPLKWACYRCPATKNLRGRTTKTQRLRRRERVRTWRSHHDLASFLLVRMVGQLLAGPNGMTDPPIERFMTKGLQTIGHDQTLAGAHRMMRANSIRHLPVLDAGKLVGILSLRDLHFVETLQDIDQEQVQVREAMTQDVFAVGPRSSVRKVAAEMADHKYGSAVVIDKGQVVGIFTTVDALKALSSLLEEQRSTPASATR